MWETQFGFVKKFLANCCRQCINMHMNHLVYKRVLNLITDAKYPQTLNCFFSSDRLILSFFRLKLYPYQKHTITAFTDLLSNTSINES